MSRLEFNRETREAALKRADGHCENRACRAVLTTGKYDFDHILPDALKGKPTLSNCMVLCRACHKEKTAKEDIPRIRKADRQRANFRGTATPTHSPLRGRPFEQKAKTPRITTKSDQLRAMREREFQEAQSNG